MVVTQLGEFMESAAEHAGVVAKLALDNVSAHVHNMAENLVWEVRPDQEIVTHSHA